MQGRCPPTPCPHVASRHESPRGGDKSWARGHRGHPRLVPKHPCPSLGVVSPFFLPTPKTGVGSRGCWPVSPLRSPCSSRWVKHQAVGAPRSLTFHAPRARLAVTLIRSDRGDASPAPPPPPPLKDGPPGAGVPGGGGDTVWLTHRDRSRVSEAIDEAEWWLCGNIELPPQGGMGGVSVSPHLLGSWGPHRGGDGGGLGGAGRSLGAPQAFEMSCGTHGCPARPSR